jgi:hypothetical protein
VYQTSANAFTQARAPSLFSTVAGMTKCAQGELLAGGHFAAIGLAYELRRLCQAINAAISTCMAIF